MNTSERVRAVFVEHAGISPTDEQLWPLAYLLERNEHSPVSLTHGDEHHELKKWIGDGLMILPRLIKKAEAEAAAAHRDGRTTDMDHLAWRLQGALAAIQPLRPATAQRNRDGAWHGFARLMAREVETIVGQWGKEPASFKRLTAPGMQIMMALLGKRYEQIKGALFPKPPKRRKK